MAKQVFDCRPGKGFTTAQSNEHQRRWTEKGWNFALGKGSYDRTREHLNFEIRKGGGYRRLISLKVSLRE